MPRELVLDKSYLQGASADSIRQLCGEYRVIMPGALFFELLTGDPDERARCFAKFPRELNPVELVEHVGRLLRFETRNDRHCGSLYERRHRMLFSFNELLSRPSFMPTGEQQQGIASWCREVTEETESFRQRVARIHYWFPTIETASNRERPAVIAGLKEVVASDSRLIRRIYAHIRHGSFPRSASVNSRWAFFRWIQVHLLAALDHVCRYGVGSDLQVARGLENEVSDFQYRILSALAGGIATRDRKSQEVFRCLRPDGVLIE